MKKNKLLLIGLLVGLLGVGSFVSVRLFLERKAVENEIASRRMKENEKKEEVKMSSQLQEEEEKGEKEGKEAEASSLKYGPKVFEDESHYIFSNKSISYKGENYIRNSAVKAYMIVGIDRRGGFNDEVKKEKKGNADSILVLAHDTANKKVKLIQVHRDSMAPVTITNQKGEELGRKLAQITIAYGFGDGKMMSVEYLAKSLSDLFGGLKFNGYYVGTLDNIKILNDYIGGVEVTVEEDGLEQFDPEFVKGKKVLLVGDKAEKYVRRRDIRESYTALKRLDRQRQYLAAFSEKLRRQLKTDSNVIVNLFKKVEETTLTGLRKDEYIGVGIDLVNGYEGGNQFITIPGFVETANKYEEFYPDLDVLYDIVVETFFRKLQS